MARTHSMDAELVHGEPGAGTMCFMYLPNLEAEVAIADAGTFYSHMPDLCPRAWLSPVSSRFFFLIFHSCSDCWVRSLFLQEELKHTSYVSTVIEMCARLELFMLCKCSVAEFLYPTASPKVEGGLAVRLRYCRERQKQR